MPSTSPTARTACRPSLAWPASGSLEKKKVSSHSHDSTLAGSIRWDVPYLAVEYPSENRKEHFAQFECRQRYFVVMLLQFTPGVVQKVPRGLCRRHAFFFQRFAPDLCSSLFQQALLFSFILQRDSGRCSTFSGRKPSFVFDQLAPLAHFCIFRVFELGCKFGSSDKLQTHANAKPYLN